MRNGDLVPVQVIWGEPTERLSPVLGVEIDRSLAARMQRLKV